MEKNLLKKTLQKIGCVELSSCAGAMQIPKELDDKLDINKLKLPFIIKDKILMSPGTWNGQSYSMNVIQKGFEQTNWDSKEIRSLFLDHQDDNKTPNMAVANWIGEVQNVRLDGTDIKGDLHIVDENTARKLAYGARFGISPRLITEGHNDQILDFQFENLSVVFTPAVKTAYINNSQKSEETEVIKMDANELREIVTEVIKNEFKKMIKPSKDVEEKMDKELNEQELADVQEIIKKAKEIQKEGESWKDAMKRASAMLSEKLEEAAPEAPKEEAPKEEAKEEAPAKEEPVKEKKEEPKEEVKEEKAEEPKEEMKEEKKEEPSEELQKIRAELSELKAKLNEPARKSTKSVELAKVEELSEDDQTRALAGYLKNIRARKVGGY